MEKSIRYKNICGIFSDSGSDLLPGAGFLLGLCAMLMSHGDRNRGDVGVKARQLKLRKLEVRELDRVKD